MKLKGSSASNSTLSVEVSYFITNVRIKKKDKHQVNSTFTVWKTLTESFIEKFRHLDQTTVPTLTEIEL